MVERQGAGASVPDAVWALGLVNDMAKLGVIENTIEERARFFSATLTAITPVTPEHQSDPSNG